MTIRASMQRMVNRSAIVLTSVILASCGVALVAAVSMGDDPAGPVKTVALLTEAQSASKTEEAPTGFDNQTNGFEDQAAFETDLKKFQEIKEISDGLGPVYNATSCVSCHQNPVTGGSTQIDNPGRSPCVRP